MMQPTPLIARSAYDTKTVVKTGFCFLFIAAWSAAACGPIRAQSSIAPGELIAPKFEINENTRKFTVQPSVAGRVYQTQASENLAVGGWQDLGDMVTGDGGGLTITTTRVAGEPWRFFRLKLHAIPAAPEGFALIPAGSFTMGASPTEESGLPAPEDSADEVPTHTVTLNAFYLQKTEVSKRQWDDIRGWAVVHGYNDLPVGSGAEQNHPVNEVNWYAVIKWCNARSEKEGFTPVYSVSGDVFRTGTGIPIANWNANGYRLPTEAEWEKAARGGLLATRYPLGDSINRSQANYRGGGVGALVDVGSFSANGYGLHDMAGNVWEWCWDLYDGNYYGSSPALNPTGPATGGADRCMRGGCWYDEFETRLRCANRGNDSPLAEIDDVGFRPALSSGQ